MLEQLIFVILLSLCNVSLIYYFHFCMEEGNILNSYYKLITYLFEKSFNFLFKILGGCIFCSSFWISLLFFTIYYFGFNGFISSFLFVIPFIGLSTGLILLIMRTQDVIYEYLDYLLKEKDQL